MGHDDQQMVAILQQLKAGALLVKRKNDGKKFPRRFFLDEHEHFISYHDSHKTWGRPRQCKWGDFQHVRFANSTLSDLRTISVNHSSQRRFPLDHIKDIDEVRAGFRAQTFDRLVRSGSVKVVEVNICGSFIDDLESITMNVFRRIEPLRSCTTIIGAKCIWWLQINTCEISGHRGFNI